MSSRMPPTGLAVALLLLGAGAVAGRGSSSGSIMAGRAWPLLVVPLALLGTLAIAPALVARVPASAATRRGAAPALAVALAVVIAVFMAGLAAVNVLDAPDQVPHSMDRPGVGAPADPARSAPRAPSPERAGEGSWPAIAAATALLITAAVLVLRRRGPGAAPVEAAGAHASAAARAAAAALAEPHDARSGVIAAYAAMEASLAHDGLARHPSETSREFLRQVLAPAGRAQPAAASLIALFERARYSTLTVTDADRDRAREWLAAIEARP